MLRLSFLRMIFFLSFPAEKKNLYIARVCFRNVYLFLPVGKVLVFLFGSSLHLPTKIFIVRAGRFPQGYGHQGFIGFPRLGITFVCVISSVPWFDAFVLAVK